MIFSANKWEVFLLMVTGNTKSSCMVSIIECIVMG